MFVVVIAVLGVLMAVVQVVNMVAVLYGLMTTGGSVLMSVVGTNVGVGLAGFGYIVAHCYPSVSWHRATTSLVLHLL